MLEIVLVYYLCKRLGTVLRAKDYKPFWMQFLLVLSWFGAEFTSGFLVGYFRALHHQGSEGQFGGMMYLLALVSAGCAASFCFVVAYMLPDKMPLRQTYAYPDPRAQAGPNFDLPPIDPDNPYSSPRGR
jgi:hypothetical protein